MLLKAPRNAPFAQPSLEADAAFVDEGVPDEDGTGGDLTHVDFASKKCKVELGDGREGVPRRKKLTPAGTWSSTDVAWHIIKLLEFDAAANEYKVEWLATVTPRPVVVEFQDSGLSSRREKAFVVGTQQMVVVKENFHKTVRKNLAIFRRGARGWLADHRCRVLT